MVDPIAQNELVKSMLDAYRLFSQEMRLIGQEKAGLIRSIIARVDAERIEDARNKLKEIAYERRR
jgi:hypothetical protein